MSNSHSKFVMSKPCQATLNNEVVDIFHQAPIANTDSAYSRAQAAIARSKKKLKYGALVWADKAADMLGAVVVRIPEWHTGVSDEYADENLDVVGTLLKKGKVWYVESDLEKVEAMRREIEFQQMKDGFLSINFHGDGSFSSDAQMYKQHLQARDKAAGGMTTRGHGLDKTYLLKLNLLKSTH